MLILWTKKTGIFLLIATVLLNSMGTVVAEEVRVKEEVSCCCLSEQDCSVLFDNACHLESSKVAFDLDAPIPFLEPLSCSSLEESVFFELMKNSYIPQPVFMLTSLNVEQQVLFVGFTHLETTPQVSFRPPQMI